jgi:hypothetical protein
MLVKGIVLNLSSSPDCFTGSTINTTKLSAEISDASDSTADEDETLRSFSDGEGVSRFLSLLKCTPCLGENAFAARMMHKTVKMLRTCRYDTVEIVSVLAVAAAKHNTLFPLLNRSSISVTELTFILLAEIYIAHCVVLDECCSLSNWHRYLFSSYCDQKSLTSAVTRILKKLDWSFQVDSTDFDKAFKVIGDSSPITYH